MLFSPVPRLGKLHRLATREERDTQGRGRESTRLVNKELPDLWKILTLEGHSISEPFRPEELAAALRRLKPGKSLDWIPSSRSSYSTASRISNFGFATSSVPA